MAAIGNSLLEARVSRAEAIARELEGEIAGGTYQPGERLGTKRDLRERFGVAVATVNEAVRLLEIRGLIQARPGPGGGVFVTDASARSALNQLILGFKWQAASLGDCVEVLDALEPLVYREAARYRTEADLRALEEMLGRMERSTDDTAYLRQTCALRRRIAKISHNAPLHSLYLTLIDFLENAIPEILAGGFSREDDLNRCEAVVHAIAQGEIAPSALTLAHPRPVAAA
jgi:GntR family transcriptional regulator, transcriptional repressor for pyruvate dehydrogenase complex